MSIFALFKRWRSKPPRSFTIISPKPRLKLCGYNNFVWYCEGGGTKAAGVGPQAAYDLWQKQQMTRACFAIQYRDCGFC